MKLQSTQSKAKPITRLITTHQWQEESIPYEIFVKETALPLSLVYN